MSKSFFNPSNFFFNTDSRFGYFETTNFGEQPKPIAMLIYSGEAKMIYLILL